jgi:hypothetical protein
VIERHHEGRVFGCQQLEKEPLDGRSRVENALTELLSLTSSSMPSPTGTVVRELRDDLRRSPSS